MIINELLLDSFRHSSERVVDALVILSQVLSEDCQKIVDDSQSVSSVTWSVADTKLSSCEYCCSVMLGLKGNPSTDLPHLILVETTY